jgi:hypothetical protein
MAGKRGFGLFASCQDDSKQPVFVVQHRALDADAKPPTFAPSPLSLVSDLIIQFCPWCGTKLDEFYREIARKMDRSSLKVI